MWSGLLAVLALSVALPAAAAPTGERGGPPVVAWTVYAGGRGFDSASAVTVSPDNSIFVAGSDEVIPDAAGESRTVARLMKLDGRDNVYWSRLYPNIELHALAVPPTGVLFGAGAQRWIRGERGGTDLAVFQFDAEGRITWRARHPATGWAVASDIAIPPSGDILVAGTEHVRYQGATRRTPAPRAVILRYSASGERLGVARIADPGRAVFGTGVIVDAERVVVSASRRPLAEEHNYWSTDYAAVAAGFTVSLDETWRTIITRREVRRQQVTANDVVAGVNGPILIGSAGLTTDNNPVSSSTTQVLIVQLDKLGKPKAYDTAGNRGLDSGRAAAVTEAGLAVGGTGFRDGTCESDFGVLKVWLFGADERRGWALCQFGHRGAAMDVAALGDGFIVVGHAERPSPARESDIFIARYGG